MKVNWRQVIFDNFSYKLVALFISLILWMTILGRRDFQVTKNVELDIATRQGIVVESQSTEHVKVKVSGPRTALRKFLDASSGPMLSLDLSRNDEGTYTVAIPTHRLDVPFGVKIISVKPSEVEVSLRRQ